MSSLFNIYDPFPFSHWGIFTYPGKNLSTDEVQFCFIAFNNVLECSYFLIFYHHIDFDESFEQNQSALFQ